MSSRQIPLIAWPSYPPPLRRSLRLPMWRSGLALMARFSRCACEPRAIFRWEASSRRTLLSEIYMRFDQSELAVGLLAFVPHGGQAAARQGDHPSLFPREPAAALRRLVLTVSISCCPQRQRSVSDPILITPFGKRQISFEQSSRINVLRPIHSIGPIRDTNPSPVKNISAGIFLIRSSSGHLG